MRKRDMAVQKRVVSILFIQLLLHVVLNPNRASGAGLRTGFYDETCPDAEAIAFETLRKAVSKDRTVAAAVLRLHYHDCFVRGCEASVLLDGAKKGDAEKDASVNFQLKRTDGPFWKVETGHRDGRVSLSTEADESMPFSFFNITRLKQNFASKGLTKKDLLYNFTGRGDAEPSLDPTYASELRKKCKPDGAGAGIELDRKSSRTFDTHFYEGVTQTRGLLISDAALLDDSATRAYVERQSSYGVGASFGRDFGESMVRMGGIGVLTGNQGEIRKRCGFVN
ncbi:unnamed protein product [Linum tenue]|uniref:Peroxidase n=1 Tax=Linum tenue TaxID=586396 RepID=A0AAV0IGN6_9ROSI|nr:unnamed protein product [Linum tenue]